LDLGFLSEPNVSRRAWKQAEEGFMVSIRVPQVDLG
jgi:hypothetical protein